MKKILFIVCMSALILMTSCGGNKDDEVIRKEENKTTDNSEKGDNIDKENDGENNKQESSNTTNKKEKVYLSYDWDEDVKNGLLYTSEGGHIVDKNGNIIDEYKNIEVLKNGALMQDGAVFDGYSSGADGKIYCLYDDLEEETKSDVNKDSLEGTYTDYDTNEMIIVEKNSDGTYAYCMYSNNAVVDTFSDKSATLEDGYLAGKLSCVVINEDKSLSITGGAGGAWGHFVKSEDNTIPSESVEEETTYVINEEDDIVDNLKDLEVLLKNGRLQYTTHNEEWKYTIYKGGLIGYYEYIILNEYMGDDLEIVMPDEIDGIRVIAIEKISKDIKSITFSKYTVKIDDYLFYECKNLEEIILPDSVLMIGERAFAYCTNVKKIRLSSNLNIDDEFSPYESIHNEAFFKCESISELVIPQGCEIVPDFLGCTNLEKLELPSSVKFVGDFRDCEKLQDFNIPNGVEHLGSFSGCISLTTVIMPDSITYFKGFSDCTNLKKVVISNSIDAIENGFIGCSSLAEIYIPSGVWYVDSNAFEGCPETMIVYGEAGSGAAKGLSYDYIFKVIE